MPFPGVRVDIGSNNLLANINVPDAVPALLMNDSMVEEEMVVYSSITNNEVKDFYAEVGGATPLVVAPAWSTGDSIDDVVERVRTFLVAHPDVNLVGLVWNDGDVATKGSSGSLASETVELLQKLQSMLEVRAAAGYPVRVFLNAFLLDSNVGDIRFSPNSAACNRVALVLGGNEGPATLGVGIALGRATRVPAHVKIGDGLEGPLAVYDIGFQGMATYDEVSVSVIEAQHDNGFLTFMRRPGLEGWYFGVDNMCSSDDFSTLVHGRVIDKAQRLAIAAYMPYVESSMQMADGGKIDAADAEAMAKVIESQLRARMGDQVSNVKVVVPLEQDLVNTHTLRVQVSVLPLGYATWISVEMNLVNQL